MKRESADGVTPQKGRSLSPRILFLLEVHNRRHGKLKSLADRLGITVQAVSDTAKRLSAEGLVAFTSGIWKPTTEGTALLHASMRDLQRFIDESMAGLRIIEETFALAAVPLHAGDAVGLYMEEGALRAGPPRATSSRGRARTDARAGGLVLVGELEGLTELRPAQITLLAHPDFPTGPSLARARRVLPKSRRDAPTPIVAAHALQSLAWAEALGFAVDLRYATLEAAREAARRGVPVLYLVPQRDADTCRAQLSDATASPGPRIPLRSVDV